MQKKYQNRLAVWIAVALIGLLAVQVSQATQDDQFAPPPVSTLDDFGVDLSSGQVAVNQTTVSIGGDLGLSHSIRLKTNDFDMRGYYGYTDGFAGGARYTKVGVFVNFGHVAFQNDTYVMRVFGPAGSADFLVRHNGSLSGNATNATSNYTYEAAGDKRHTLVESADRRKLTWTTPNGTKTIFERSSSITPKAGGQGFIRQVIYPNGLTLDISVGGVKTNTGYVLKYDYLSGHSANLSSSKQSMLANLPSNAQVYLNAGWSKNPRKIIGVNQAYQYCSLDTQASCNATNWPKAEFIWPGGMPTAFFLGESVFSVKDMSGSTTDYHYDAKDVCLAEIDNPNSYASSCIYDQNTHFSPRLVGIKSADSSEIDRTFKYENDYTYRTNGYGGVLNYFFLKTSTGRIVHSSGLSGQSVYSDPESNILNGGEDRFRTGRGLRVEIDGALPNGALIKVISEKEGTYEFEQTFRNFLTKHSPLSAPQKNYFYDSRGNLDKVVITNVGTQEADYPSNCNYPKTCNKPLWTTDPKGQRTDFEYHPTGAHGYPIKITKPADKNGKRPATVYQYSALHAYYKNSSGQIVRDDRPVWLLTKEHTCRNSVTTDTGCTGGNSDRVLTEYDYGPQNGEANNLLLVGQSVTAVGNNGQQETRVFCYQYDKVGNKIGEVLPKGNGNDILSCR